MEVEVIAGTYDCAIRGFSVDLLSPREKSLQPKFQDRDHSGSVRTLACGGRYLASGSTDETIRLYDMRKHREVGTILEHEGTITWLSFHGRSHLFSASEDRTVCIWECGTWKHLHTLTGHKSAVTCVSVHPSGKLALTVSKDRTIRTWNLVTGYQAYRKKLQEAAKLVEWSPIGDQYVLAFEKSIAVYEVDSADAALSFEVGKPINCFLYIKDSVIAVGSEHPHILLFSTATGQCLAKLEGHTNRVKGLGLSPGGELLFSASSNGAIKAWRLSETLSESQCVCSVESGSRLTCLAVVYPEHLRKEIRSRHAHRGTGSTTQAAGEGGESDSDSVVGTKDEIASEVDESVKPKKKKKQKPTTKGSALDVVAVGGVTDEKRKPKRIGRKRTRDHVAAKSPSKKKTRLK